MLPMDTNGTLRTVRSRYSGASNIDYAMMGQEELTGLDKKPTGSQRNTWKVDGSADKPDGYSGSPVGSTRAEHNGDHANRDRNGHGSGG